MEPGVCENFKSASFNDELPVSARHTPGLVGIDHSAVERTPNSSETLNNHKQNEDTYRFQSSGQSTAVVQLPLNEDKGINSVLEKGSQAAIEKICQSGTLGYEQRIKRKRGRAVKSVSKWVFPPNTENKHKFVASSLQRGITPEVVLERVLVEDSKDVRTTSPSLSTRKSSRRVNRKRSLHERDLGTKNMIHPIVRGAEFDKRFLRYELTPAGERKEDILVRSMSLATIPMRKVGHSQAALRGNYIETIPDEPSRSESSSRIGPRYQALIPSKSIDNAGSGAEVDSFVPSYSMLWDPKLADEAQQRGEDISGFLAGNHELCKHELLLKILHENNYIVDAARRALVKIQKRNGGFPSTRLNEEESQKFRKVIHKTQKDFSSIAKSLKRKRSDCLVHYYNWKSSNRRYQSIKKGWSDGSCCVCGEVGLLIICDGCNSNFHMECTTPPLSEVPKGNWFCDSCRYSGRTVPSIYNGKKTLSPEEQTHSNTMKSDTESTSSGDHFRDEMQPPTRLDSDCYVYRIR